MKQTKTLTMDSSIGELLITIAKKEDRTVVGLIRNAIKEYLLSHYNIDIIGENNAN